MQYYANVYMFMTSLTSSDDLQTEIMTAARRAYETLAREGMPAEAMHKLCVCYQASALITDSLVENGYTATHEIQNGSTVVEHSFVTVKTRNGEELLVDPTWQQFLPKDKITPELPRVLIGDRSEVIAKAREFGVDEKALKIWEYQPNAMTVEQQKLRDRGAEDSADMAFATGAWERFATSSNHVF